MAEETVTGKPDWESMSLFEKNPAKLPRESGGSEETAPAPQEIPESATAASDLPLGGDPISYVAVHPEAGHPPTYNVPEDLRISWSWIHLVVFGIFVFVLLVAVDSVVFGYYSVYKHLSQRQLRHVLESDANLNAGTSLVVFAVIMLFLYVSLSLLRDAPFWRTLGWKKLKADALRGKGRPWMYFVSGSGLSLFVVLAGSQVKDAEHVPINEMFKSRSGMLLLMSMAVLVAPVVEETIFRGYLYPVFARIISAIAQYFGMEGTRAIRTGVASSILVTGTLFGLVHGPQLGENWELVSLLIVVGVIFTFARAWTGTVLASFLLHLGYNSMIAITAIIGTKGFTHMPPR